MNKHHNSKPYFQTTTSLKQINKGHFLLRFDLWPLCSENQLQSPNLTFLDTKTLLTSQLLTITQPLDHTMYEVGHNIIICVTENRFYQSEQELKESNTTYGWEFVSSSALKKYSQCPRRRQGNVSQSFCLNIRKHHQGNPTTVNYVY